jgi:hypothetical protein
MIGLALVPNSIAEAGSLSRQPTSSSAPISRGQTPNPFSGLSVPAVPQTVRNLSRTGDQISAPRLQDTLYTDLANSDDFYDDEALTPDDHQQAYRAG